MIENSAGHKIEKIWILGGGKFGQIALEQLVGTVPCDLPGVEITLVDMCRDGLKKWGDQVTTVHGEGIEWLAANLKRETGAPDIVIPAIPVHVVFEWLKRKTEGVLTIVPESISQEIYKKIPNPMRKIASQVYVSHADFLCPENCSEPAKICTFTKKERAESMFLLLANLKSKHCSSLVVRSHQLFPGVGGIVPADLWNIFDQIMASPGKNFLVATACRCHGVVDGFRTAPVCV